MSNTSLIRQFSLKRSVHDNTVSEVVVQCWSSF